MRKKVSFPRVEECGTFVEVRHLLSKVRWKSQEYKALMLRWREICRTKIREIQVSFDPPSKLCPVLRELYGQCPCGSAEELVTYGFWQACQPHDSELKLYRARIIKEAFTAGKALDICL
ncbi:MAG: hypothetical protein EXS46_00925 [Candidatus Taylorbacteria bacterium]|nr:hypothetical protein [Candidatus Taylorbacteria bacterium]